MLRSFRVANHRSILEEQELSLLPAYDKDRPAVPVVALYGANASGKSNVLDALVFMADAVRDSFARWDPDGGVPRRPFRLDPAGDGPSTFVAEFTVEGTRHTYGFVVDDERVLSEWLYSYPENRKRVVFQRMEDALTFGSTIHDSKVKTEVLEELTRPNALFLSVAGQAKMEAAASVHTWWTRGLRMSSAVVGLRDVGLADRVVRFINRGPDNGRRLIELLRVADLGIDGVVVQTLAPVNATTDPNVEPPDRPRTPVRYRLRLRHGRETSFDLRDESAGTRSWLSLLPTALRALDDGATLVVDEIDGSLHPKLTAQLVRLFQEPETNPKGAQLIFTTHDTSLLGTMVGDVLKRDQIWFVEKDQRGRSSLYPLTDFKPRQGENTERRYLGGAYGAVPVLSEREFMAAVAARGDDGPS